MKKTETSTEKSSSLDWFFITGLGVFAYFKYQNFKRFINSLSFGVDVQEITSKTAVIYLSTLKKYGIDYCIKSVTFLSNDNVIAKTLADPKLRKKIVKNSKIPITISLLSLVNEEQLQSSSIVVEYQFLGFITKRVYQLKNTKKNLNNPVTIDVTNASGNYKNEHAECGCK